MKTYSTRPSEVEVRWHVIDATGRPLGRLASEVAHLLKGKHKPQYAPNLLIGDYVVIVNAEKVRVSGTKIDDKVYYHHTQYPGGLRQITFRQLMQKNPRKVLEHAIKGMLPHNRLGRRIGARLKVYAGPDHPHQAQIAGFGAANVKTEATA